VVKLGSRAFGTGGFQEFGERLHDLENGRLEEYSQQRHEEFPKGLKDSTQELAEHESLVEVKLLFRLLAHGPLGDLEDARTKLLLVKLDNKRVEALYDRVLHRVANFDPLLVCLVRQSKALFEESDKLLAVFLNELCGQVLEHWAEELAEVSISLLVESRCPNTLRDNLVVRVESCVNGKLLMRFGFQADSVEHDGDLTAFISNVTAGCLGSGHGCDQLLELLGVQELEEE